jgi:hypothetical protein
VDQKEKLYAWRAFLLARWLKVRLFGKPSALVILSILWLLGLVSGYTMGGIIHILLVIAIVVVLIRVIQGRRPW